MAVDSRTQAQATQLSADRPTLADIVEQLVRFEGPPEQFLVNLLAVQCHVSSAQAGAILRGTPEGKIEALSIYPPMAPESTAPVWLAQAVESCPQVITTGRTVIKSLRQPDELYGQPSQHHLIMVPIRGGTNVRGSSAFFVEANDPAVLAAIRDRLELTSSWLSLYEMRLTLARRQADLRRLRVTMETLVAVNEQERFAATAMTLCNEVASRWQADRVGLGLLKGRYVKLKALSHTEKFSRKQKLVQNIEGAMEECVDQNVEIIHPAPEGATYVSRAHDELCKQFGPAALVSMPMRRAGQPMAVLILQRPVDRPFSLEELEALRLACDLCTPRVAVLHEHDRWVGAKMVSGTKKLAGFAVGSKHTWAKLVAIGVIAVGLFVTLAKGTHRAEAPFALEAVERQRVSAPYDAFLSELSSNAKGDVIGPGDFVSKGTVLARLKTNELQAKLIRAKAEQQGYLTEAEQAKDKGETSKQQIAEAQARRVGAEIELLNQQIADAEIVAPISGLVLSGDWKNAKGARLKLGDLMFEVAPVDSLYADLSLPEDQVADVREGQEGELATQADPGDRIKFVVERVNPVAEVVEQKNVFKVRVRLLDHRPWMKVGMEGVAKVSLGKDRYINLWTRRLVNWLRMQLWL
ncbi:MAG: HlyD family efflux transporter periplasmic adaptor subunit [Phycisphaerae bacterium]|nr:HlyD family efflux transporter periplasmic adaptor subunit [Phycisphaerae bacterium]